MTVREKFNAIMSGECFGDTLLWELESTSDQNIRKWSRDENLPIGKNISDILKFDGRRTSFSYSTTPPIPAFVEKVISNDEKSLIKIDSCGNTVKYEKDCMVSPTHYAYLDGPIHTKEDWDRLKKRFDPYDIRRFPLAWGDELFEYYNASVGAVSFEMSFGPGRGSKNYYMMGFERFMEVIIYEQELMEDILEFWTDYMIKFLGTFIDKLDIDYFNIMEDGMAYKNSTIISPETFKKLHGKYLKKLADFLRSKGVDKICYYTSGNIEKFIPVLLESGVNMIAPMESVAGMDAVKLREQYANDLLMMGNLSKESVLSGKQAIDEEIEAKLPCLVKKGGYIPALDDMITPDMTLENVLYFIDKVKNFRS